MAIAQRRLSWVVLVYDLPKTCLLSFSSSSSISAVSFPKFLFCLSLPAEFSGVQITNCTKYRHRSIVSMKQERKAGSLLGEGGGRDSLDNLKLIKDKYEDGR